MEQAAWRSNRQALVHTAADDTFGLSRDEDGARRRQWLQPGPATHGADGLPAPGLLFMLADSLLGGACIEAIGPDEVIVTSNLHLDLHATPFVDGAPIRGESTPATLYHGTAGAAGRLTAAERVVATASGRFAVLDSQSRTGGQVARARTTAPTASPMAADVWRVDAPIHDLLGASFMARGDRALSMTVDAAPAFANERSGIHGGVGALIGERACDALIRRVAPDVDYRTVELRAAFLRPVPADGTRLEAVAHLEHLGRRLVAVTATLTTAAGAPAVVVDLLAAGPPD